VVVLAQMGLGVSSNDGQVCRARRGFVANHMQSRARAGESEVPIVGLLSMVVSARQETRFLLALCIEGRRARTS
jgi:hypothetical protein